MASFFKTNGGDGQNKGRGRGPPRSQEERKAVNAARVAEGLASKSTKSVSRSKARALAHRASIDSKFGPPAVRPPPLPKAPTRAPVVLLEAQPRSGGRSPQHEGPSLPLQAMGEAPFRDRGKQGPQYTEEMPTTSSEPSRQVPAKKRPKASDSEGKGKDKRTKQGEVLPKDKRELEATSSGQSTESWPVLATPWQRRVRLRTALEAKDKTRLRCWLRGYG